MNQEKAEEAVRGVIGLLQEHDLLDDDADPEEYEIEWPPLWKQLMSSALPDTCPNCGIDIDPSKVEQQGDDVQCASCGATLEMGESTRVNYKSPVVEESDDEE